MADDYKGAALRHFDDAKLLLDQGKLDNAGHLIGFAGECAIKHKIRSLRPDKVEGHFPQLISIAKKHLGARSDYTVEMFNLFKEPIFEGWSVHRRYNATGETSAEEVTAWFKNAGQLMRAASIKREKKREGL